MRKKKQKNEDFFIETIDLTPSQNIQTVRNGDYVTPKVPEYDTGASEHIDEYRFAKRFGRKLKKYGLTLFLITLCLYMVFLIIGASLTNYYVDSETGIRKPIFVTYSDVADKHDYNALKDEISILRDVLVDVRITEIKYNNGDISQYEAANAYSQYLKRIDIIIPKVTAMNVKDTQETTKNAIVGCYKTYLAGYLQEMEKGLSNSDANAVNSALQYRELMLQSYFSAEESLKLLGDKLKLTDDFFDWELDKAAEEKDPTAVLKK